MKKIVVGIVLLVSIYNSTKAQSIINGELKNLLNQ